MRAFVVLLLLIAALAFAQQRNGEASPADEAAALADLMRFRESQNKRTDKVEADVVALTRKLEDLSQTLDRATTGLTAALERVNDRIDNLQKAPAQPVAPVAKDPADELSPQRSAEIVKQYFPDAGGPCVKINGTDHDVGEYIAKHYKRNWTLPVTTYPDGRRVETGIDEHLVEHGVDREDLAALDEATKRKLHSAMHEAGDVPETHQPVAKSATHKQPSVVTRVTTPMQNCPGGVCPAPSRMFQPAQTYRAGYQHGYQTAPVRSRTPRSSRRASRRGSASTEQRGPLGVIVGAGLLPFRLAARILI